MEVESHDGSDVMARLTISALGRISNDSSIWSDPEVHRAILVSGLSVLISNIKCIDQDLLKDN